MPASRAVCEILAANIGILRQSCWGSEESIEPKGRTVQGHSWRQSDGRLQGDKESEREVEQYEQVGMKSQIDV